MQNTNGVLQHRTDEIEEKFFYQLAERSGARWEKIGIFLQLGSSFLEQLRQDFPPGVANYTTSCAFRVFMRWQQKAGGTLGDLCDVLVEAGEEDLARFVKEKAFNFLRKK